MCRSSHPRETSTSIRPPTRRPAARRALHPHLGRAGKPSQARRQIEHRRAFQEKVKWRTGSEGRISHLKRNYGWNRTRLVTIEGARTWCGHGVFTHNLVKISKMAA